MNSVLLSLSQKAVPLQYSLLYSFIYGRLKGFDHNALVISENRLQINSFRLFLFVLKMPFPLFGEKDSLRGLFSKEVYLQNALVIEVQSLFSHFFALPFHFSLIESLYV